MTAAALCFWLGISLPFPDGAVGQDVLANSAGRQALRKTLPVQIAFVQQNKHLARIRPDLFALIRTGSCYFGSVASVSAGILQKYP